MARPTSFNEDLAAAICARIAEGEPLTKVCKSEDMPATSTVYAWLRQKPEFVSMYETARRDCAHTLAAEILEISDEAPLVVEVDGQQITAKLDMAAVQRNRNRLDARKWVAAKLLPRVYADQIGIGGAPDLPAASGPPTFEDARMVLFSLRRGQELLREAEEAKKGPPPQLGYVPPTKA